MMHTTYTELDSDLACVWVCSGDTIEQVLTVENLNSRHVHR